MKTTRRAILAGIAVTPIIARMAMAETVGGITRLDPALDAVVDVNAPIEVLGIGYRWAEGPVWVREHGYLLYNDPPSNITYKWQDGKGISTFRSPSGLEGPIPDHIREAGANGMAIDAQGRLVFADSGTRAISRVSLAGGPKEILAAGYQGKKFNSCNDLTIARSGAIYFTDPPYGLADADASTFKELPHNGVYRLHPKSGVVTLLDASMRRPNGVALSPDERRLYLALSDEHRPEIRVYDLDANGDVLGESRLFHDFKPEVDAKLPGLPDGLRVDTAGRLYVTGPGGVYILSPEGKRLGLISTGKAVANCCFGDDGKTLYMTSHTMLARVRLKAGGW